MVRVSCMTFNQATYIEDAMNGFCMQETNFPFVCTILDDCSTDGEQDVIKNYLEAHFDLEDSSVVRNEETDDYFLTFAQHKTNKKCYFAVLFLKYNHYSIKKLKKPYIKEWCDTKYVALCEGDDYWIDPLKLQKQVDFMEAHPKHSLCFCANQRLLPSGEIVFDKRYDSDMEICPMKDIILGGGGYMATNSMLYRQSMYVPYTTWASKCSVGDLPMTLTLACKGYVGYIADIMCVYRVTAAGSWSSTTYSDIKKVRSINACMITMWQQFDAWTDGLYSKLVALKIKALRRQRFLYEIKNIKDRFLSMLGFKNQVNRML